MSNCNQGRGSFSFEEQLHARKAVKDENQQQWNEESQEEINWNNKKSQSDHD